MVPESCIAGKINSSSTVIRILIFQLSHGMAKGSLASLSSERKAEYRKYVMADFSKMRESVCPPQNEVIPSVASKAE